MVKAKFLYIFEGPTSVTLLRGAALVGDETKSAIVKGRGLFGGTFPITGVDETYLGEPKMLYTGKKFLNNWRVMKIGIDFMSQEPFIPEVPPDLIQKIKSLRSELEMWKKRYYNVRGLTQDENQKDRYRERVKRDFKFAGEAKGYLTGMSDFGGMGMSPFYNRWGLGSGIPPSSGGSGGDTQ